MDQAPPLFAGLLALFYRKRHVVEHVYFALHLHAFAFLALGVIALLKFAHSAPLSMAAGVSVLVWIPVYAHLAFRRVYGDSRRLCRGALGLVASALAQASSDACRHTIPARGAPTVMNALSLKGIRKKFGSTTAVHDLDLEVPGGALYGVIGPNGAGKTTTIRMIMSILFPDAGELSVLGHPSALDAKDRIGYMPEERGVYRKMLVGAFLTYVARLKGVKDAGLPARVRQSLERVELGDAERKRCEELSKGTLQKVQILAAIIHQPDLLILDEPFSGLDPVSTRLLRDIVLDEHRRGATILFSTHVMHQAEDLCGHVVMIHRGCKVLDEQVSAIRRRYDPRTVRFEPLDPAADLSSLRALAEVERVEPSASGFDIKLVEGSDPGSAIRRITAAVTPARIELARPALEDVFVSIVAGTGQPVEAGGARHAGSVEAGA